MVPSAIRNQVLIAFGALGLLTILLHGEAASGWWVEDDPQLLLQAMRETPATIFFSPQRWRLYSASNFAPFAPFAYKIDLRLGGLDPRFFYVHHLLVLSAAAILLFAWLRKRLDNATAFLTACAFLAAPVTVYAARTLMLRHYVEGLCLALLAMLFWERGARLGTLLSAVAYLLAALCKEIYAPLPLIFLACSILKRDSFRSLAARMIPIAMAAAIYGIWRAWMLGSVGGYGSGGTIGDLAFLPAATWNTMTAASPWWWSAIWLGTMAGVFLHHSARSPRRAVALFLALFFAFLPLFPVAAARSIRFAFVPCILAVVALPLLVAPVAGWRRWLVATGLLAIVFIGGWERRKTNERNLIMSAEGRYVWEQSADVTPLLSTSREWYIDGLRVLRQLTGRGDAPDVYLSGFGLVLNGQEEFIQLNRHQDIWPRVEGLRAKFSSQPAYMSLVIRRIGNRLEWSFAPQASSKWMWLTLHGYKAVHADPRGWGRFPRDAFPPSIFMAEPFGAFRVVRIEPNGYWSVSPEFQFPSDGEVISWSSDSHIPRP